MRALSPNQLPAKVTGDRRTKRMIHKNRIVEQYTKKYKVTCADALQFTPGVGPWGSASSS